MAVNTRDRFIQVNIQRDTKPMRLVDTMPMSLLVIGTTLEHTYFDTAKEAKEALLATVELTEEEVIPEAIERALRTIDVMFMQKRHYDSLGVVAVESEGDIGVLLDEENPFADSYRFAVEGATEEGINTLAEWVGNQSMFFYPTFHSIEEYEDFLELHNDKETVFASIHDDETQNLGAGIAALASGYFFGDWVVRYKSVNGITVPKFKSSEIDKILELNGNTYIRNRGNNVVIGGRVVGGEYIDIIETEHYLLDQMISKMWGILTTHDKVAYEQPGIDLFEGGMKEVLSLATDRGVLARDGAGNAMFTTSAPLREDINVDYVKNRILPDLNFVAIPSGAIDELRINGVLTFDTEVLSS